ncbi:MAG: hypothetical protein Q4C86_10815 [bacterium]|nr:hypothetical protein [bacterium]
MDDFEIPGIGKARMKLTDLSRNPTGKSRVADDVKEKLIKELYVEIRAARMAGHTWKSIRAAIVSDINLKISEICVNRMFTQLDKEYKAETGVAALPNQSRGGHKRGTGRKGKKQEVEPNADR